MDEARLTPSARWWKAIEQNVETCAAFIVVMSPNAYESDWVEREILLAESKKRPIYPVLLAGNAWSRLANIQFEDLRAGLRATLSQHFVQSLHFHLPKTKQTIELTIREDNIAFVPADVAIFKHAQRFYGADSFVAALLDRGGVSADQLSVPPGEYRLVATEGLIAAPYVLYVGTEHIRTIGYQGVRELASRALLALMREAPDARQLAMTLHGPGAGLDEVEALLAQIGGYLDALERRQFPPALERITIVEQDSARVHRLRQAANQHLAGVGYAEPLAEGWGYRLSPAGGGAIDAGESRLEDAGVKSEAKPFAYVALASRADADDVYYYGIQGAVHACGLLCVRLADEAPMEEILDQARQQIDAASLVVIDLTEADSLLYLQLGYAWGKGRPTLAFAKSGYPLAPEVAVTRYDKIKSLEAAVKTAFDDLNR
jgi:hypothetical protein